MSKTHTLQICEDPRGVLSVYLSNHRITGRETKPYGNATTRKAFLVEEADLRAAMGYKPLRSRPAAQEKEK